jgi:hypothetical protein
MTLLVLVLVCFNLLDFNLLVYVYCLSFVSKKWEFKFENTKTLTFRSSIVRRLETARVVKKEKKLCDTILGRFFICYCLFCCF